VELFFCLSGFVIIGSAERTVNFKRFVISRFARLYPAYLLCALITLATLWWAGLPFAAVTPRALAVNATMLASFSGTQLIDPSYWTLTYEVIFYGCLALAWFVLGRQRLEWLCLAWLACSLVGHLYPWVALHHRLTVLFDVDYANLFVLGMMVFCLAQGTRTRLTLPTLCGAFLMTLFPPQFNRGHLSQPAYVLMIGTFCALIWLIADSGGRFLDFKPLVFLGEISYCLYLIHQIVGFALIRTFLRWGLGTNETILLTISLMMGVAFCLRNFAEQPAERWIKRLSKPTRKNAESTKWAGEHWQMGA
jgi:peptidoglycan/LPS O-acetylase OafA/YrhL